MRKKEQKHGIKKKKLSTNLKLLHHATGQEFKENDSEQSKCVFCVDDSTHQQILKFLQEKMIEDMIHLFSSFSEGL